MTESRGSRALLAPLLAGLLGAGLALLFAPRSGKQTREKMRMKAQDVKQQAQDNLSNVRDSLDQSIREAQDLKKRIGEAWQDPSRRADQEAQQLRRDQDTHRTPAQSSVLSTWEEEV